MISIIIPTYNEEKLIGQCLSRLKLLTLPNEIIVTDDKSTDNTVAIAKTYTDKVLCPTAKHATIAQNRNAGARTAIGDILVFMDVQSYIKDPDQFFTRALENFKNNPKLVALTGVLWVLPELETRTDRIVYTIFNWVHRFKNNVMHSGEASGKFQMIRRESFEKVGGFREDLVTSEDGDMFSRLSKIGRTLCDPELVIFHPERRAHALGWPRLLWIWMTERLWFTLFNKSISKEWKAIR